jgi:hypothetical protein
MARYERSIYTDPDPKESRMFRSLKKSVAVLMNVRWHLMNGKPPKWKNGVKVVAVAVAVVAV